MSQILKNFDNGNNGYFKNIKQMFYYAYKRGAWDNARIRIQINELFSDFIGENIRKT